MSAAMSGQVTRQPLGDVWGDVVPTTVITPASAEWVTPGRTIAGAISHRPEVRLVVERLEADRYAVFVILDSDPEDLLDEILEAERVVFLRPRGLPFDLRIMKPQGDWSDADLLRDSFILFERLPRRVGA